MGHAETHRTLHACFNERRFEDMEHHLAPRFRYVDVARGIVMQSPREYVDWMAEWTGSFGDGRLCEAQYLEGPDHCVSLFQARGTNDGPLGDLPATDADMDVAFCEVLRFGPDGRVVAGEMYYDQMTMLEQLGVLHLPHPDEDVLGLNPM